MADGVLERVEKLESNVRSSLSQLRHWQQLSEAELKRDTLANLEQMRREMSDVVSRMASLAEFNALKDDLNKVFNLVGNPNGSFFSNNSSGGVQQVENNEVVERLEKTVNSCAEKLDKLQASLESIDIRSKVSQLEERLEKLERALSKAEETGGAQNIDSKVENKTKNGNKTIIFDDEPVEWG